MDADRFVDVVRAAGVDGLRAGDVRDAAHETFHAQHIRFRGRRDRERVHAALFQHFAKHARDWQAALWIHELTARVVEDEVCKIFGVPSGKDFRNWCAISMFEASEHGLPYAEINTETWRFLDRWRAAYGLAEAKRVVAWAKRRAERCS